MKTFAHSKFASFDQQYNRIQEIKKGQISSTTLINSCLPGLDSGAVNVKRVVQFSNSNAAEGNLNISHI